VVGILSEVFITRSNAEWLAILDEYDIPNAPVNDMEQVFTDPQVLARGMVGIYKHPTLGEIRYPPSPIKWSDWESPNEPAPMLGQHTVEVLTGRLGLEESEVRKLADEGVVKVWPES
jgi:crotonobetainyl-CoA:carnitine CoA-transferase CaiB-like acyl-CoA transferase